MSDKQALKLALKSLEFYYDLYREKVDAEAITAIKEALAQSEQEPIGINGLTEAETSATASVMGLVNTAPPRREWVGLTDEEINDCMSISIQKTCRAIEAKLREKNG